MEISSFTICYCKRVSKEKKDEEAMLQQQLSSLHRLMCESPLQDTIAKYYEVKLKLEQISKRKTEGGMIRSKARWCEQGERYTRYFFNLERRNHLNKYITELKTENLTLSNPTEILNEEYRYYKNLYTSNLTNPNDYDFVEFFYSATLPKLTPQEADTCDSLLTKEECLASLKQFSKGKSPGTDGLTAEFYLAFWELLGQELVDSLNHAFEMDEMKKRERKRSHYSYPKEK